MLHIPHPSEQPPISGVTIQSAAFEAMGPERRLDFEAAVRRALGDQTTAFAWHRGNAPSPETTTHQSWLDLLETSRINGQVRHLVTTASLGSFAVREMGYPPQCGLHSGLLYFIGGLVMQLQPKLPRLPKIASQEMGNGVIYLGIGRSTDGSQTKRRWGIQPLAFVRGVDRIERTDLKVIMPGYGPDVRSVVQTYTEHLRLGLQQDVEQ